MEIQPNKNIGVNFKPCGSLLSELDKILGKLYNPITIEEKGKLQETKTKIIDILENLKIVITQLREKNNFSYNLEDYKNRLCVNEEILEKIFKERILEIPEIKEIIKELEKLIVLDNFQIILKRLKRDLFENLIYEIMDENDYKMEENIWIHEKHTIEDYKKEIQETGKRGIKILYLGFNNLGELGVECTINLVQEAGRNGIKILMLYSNNLSELGEEGIIELIQEAGRNGIKHLDLGWNNLWELGAEKIIELLQEAGRNKIKSLDLRWNDLSPRLKETLQKTGKDIGINIII